MNQLERGAVILETENHAVRKFIKSANFRCFGISWDDVPISIEYAKNTGERHLGQPRT